MEPIVSFGSYNQLFNSTLARFNQLNSNKRILLCKFPTPVCLSSDSSLSQDSDESESQPLDPNLNTLFSMEMEFLGSPSKRAYKYRCRLLPLAPHNMTHFYSWEDTTSFLSPFLVLFKPDYIHIVETIPDDKEGIFVQIPTPPENRHDDKLNTTETTQDLTLSETPNHEKTNAIDTPQENSSSDTRINVRFQWKEKGPPGTENQPLPNDLKFSKMDIILAPISVSQNGIVNSNDYSKPNHISDTRTPHLTPLKASNYSTPLKDSLETFDIPSRFALQETSKLHLPSLSDNSLHPSLNNENQNSPENEKSFIPFPTSPMGIMASTPQNQFNNAPDNSVKLFGHTLTSNLHNEKDNNFLNGNGTDGYNQDEKNGTQNGSNNNSNEEDSFQQLPLSPLVPSSGHSLTFSQPFNQNNTLFVGSLSESDPQSSFPKGMYLIQNSPNLNTQPPPADIDLALNSLQSQQAQGNLACLTSLEATLLKFINNVDCYAAQTTMFQKNQNNPSQTRKKKKKSKRKVSNASISATATSSAPSQNSNSNQLLSEYDLDQVVKLLSQDSQAVNYDPLLIHLSQMIPNLLTTIEYLQKLLSSSLESHASTVSKLKFSIRDHNNTKFLLHRSKEEHDRLEIATRDNIYRMNEEYKSLLSMELEKIRTAFQSRLDKKIQEERNKFKKTVIRIKQPPPMNNESKEFETNLTTSEKLRNGTVSGGNSSEQQVKNTVQDADNNNHSNFSLTPEPSSILEFGVSSVADLESHIKIDENNSHASSILNNESMALENIIVHSGDSNPTSTGSSLSNPNKFDPTRLGSPGSGSASSGSRIHSLGNKKTNPPNWNLANENIMHEAQGILKQFNYNTQSLLQGSNQQSTAQPQNKQSYLDSFGKNWLVLHLLESASNGDPLALNNLGYMYTNNIIPFSSEIPSSLANVLFSHVPKSSFPFNNVPILSPTEIQQTLKSITSKEILAFHFYLSAAKRGLGTAQNNVASCFMNGIGCTFSLDSALFWYRQAENNCSPHVNPKDNIGWCSMDTPFDSSPPIAGGEKYPPTTFDTERNASENHNLPVGLPPHGPPHGSPSLDMRSHHTTNVNKIGVQSIGSGTAGRLASFQASHAFGPGYGNIPPSSSNIPGNGSHGSHGNQGQGHIQQPNSRQIPMSSVLPSQILSFIQARYPQPIPPSQGPGFISQQPVQQYQKDRNGNGHGNGNGNGNIPLGQFHPGTGNVHSSHSVNQGTTLGVGVGVHHPSSHPQKYSHYNSQGSGGGGQHNPKIHNGVPQANQFTVQNNGFNPSFNQQYHNDIPHSTFVPGTLATLNTYSTVKKSKR